jgi:S1-C subfamily serine protease
MKRFIVCTLIAWFMVGCAGVPGGVHQKRAFSVPQSNDGRYDNNTFLVDSQAMSLSRIIESLYTVRTEVEFRVDANGQLFKRDLKGTGVVLFGKYLLTVEHVTRLESPTVKTPIGKVKVESTKVSERTFLDYKGKSYPLERLVVDKEIDVALFRLPEGLGLVSFPYQIGNSDDLQVGNFVYLIGNPMNFGINVREGIVSSLKAPNVVREVDSIAENAFMVSNGLNPGDSGTPVIAIRDGQYELVGLSQGSFIRSQRLGWVIRINTVLRRIQASIETRVAVLGDQP